MSKHYTFQHTCGHIGIGPLIRPPSGAFSSSADPQPSSPSPLLSVALESIDLNLPIPCPFCENTQPYLNVAPGDGLLAILEPLAPRTTIFESNSAPSPRFTLSPGSPGQGSFCYNWRILRVLPAHEVESEDWHLAHTAEGHFRQMAWIPKPCGRVGVGVGAWREARDEEVVWRLTCVWRQRLGEGVAARSNLPGMWSSCKASLRGAEAEGDAERLPETFAQLNTSG